MGQSDSRWRIRFAHGHPPTTPRTRLHRLACFHQTEACNQLSRHGENARPGSLAGSAWSGDGSVATANMTRCRPSVSGGGFSGWAVDAAGLSYLDSSSLLWQSGVRNRDLAPEAVESDGAVHRE